MKLVTLSYQGQETELDEHEAKELYVALQAGMKEAGIDTQQLSTFKRPIGAQSFSDTSMPHELTDC